MRARHKRANQDHMRAAARLRTDLMVDFRKAGIEVDRSIDADRLGSKCGESAFCSQSLPSDLMVLWEPDRRAEEAPWGKSAAADWHLSIKRWLGMHSKVAGGAAWALFSCRFLGSGKRFLPFACCAFLFNA